ncbi:uncharacterized protein LOC119738818 [Patiria miniata]|uniref:Ig-like domain-containing protein n=1 Tax=Patiria miniata TaxID=46514 RepID=A0A914B142_PATMI|nr:uncharacterized protein LOC119738818 [Patiria miniata]
MGLLAVTAVFLLVVGIVSSISLGTGPDATEARAGETVELRCDVNYRNGEPILWYHDPSKSYVTYNRDVSDTLDADRRQRYSVRGSEYWHVFNLRIENLKPTDDGFFYCGYLDRGTFTVLGSARLTVIYPPDEKSPVCSFNMLDQPNSTNATVGSSVDLTCMWTGGNPSPTAAWYRLDASMDTHQGNGYVWMRRELTDEDNGVEFICEMESEGLDQKRSCSAMPLRIPPRAIITPSTAYARVGDTVEFVCEGIGLPRIVWYTWEGPPGLTRRQGRYELLAGNRVLRVFAVEAEDDGLEITCRVRTSRGLEATESAVLRVVLPTTPGPTTVPETTTEAVPSTTLNPNPEKETAKVTTGVIDRGAVSPKSPKTTPAPPPPDDSQPIAALPKTTIIGIGVAAGAVLVLIIAVLIIFMKRSRKSQIRRDTSIHLVNSTYETVIEGGRVVDQEISPPPGFENYDRPRPIAAVSPLPQTNSANGVKPSVRYAKVNKKKPRDIDPLYDQVPDETAVDLGLGSPTPRREPTYVNQGAMEIRQEPDPRGFNAEGLTYAELELDREGRLHSKKSHTLYAKLK